MGSYYFTLNPSKMSWSAFKGYWSEQADDLTERCKGENRNTFIEFNPKKWTKESFSFDRAKEFMSETADDLTERCKNKRFNTFIEFNPAKWNKDSFSIDRYSDFMGERMETSPIFRYGINLATSNAKPITNLSMSKRAKTKFVFDATSKAIRGKTVSDEYTLLEHKKDSNTGYEVFIQCSDNNKTVIISYKDTDDLKDVFYSDIPMAEGRYPAQLPQALVSYKKIAENYPGYKIIVSGLSLGGSLSELVASSPLAAKHGKTVGYSFNGYGVAGPILKSCGEGFKDNGNVTAICAKADRIVGRAAKHVGDEYIVNSGIESISDLQCFHHISFMDDEMENMAKNEDLYNKLLHPQIDINSATAKYP